MSTKGKNDRSPITQRMRELREAHGRTQQECAEALGVAQPTYAEMEHDKGRVRRRDLVTLAVLYGMPLEEAFPTFEQADAA